MKTAFWQATWAIFQKDLRAEWRSRELIGIMLMFALLSVLIFSFALELDRVVRREAIAGVLWVTVVFASVLGLNRSMALEREQGSIDALLLAPIHRSALFMGKFMGNFLFTLAIALLLLPIMTVIYNITIITVWSIVTLFLGIWGICATGTLLSAMTIQTRTGEALLPIALLPIVLPIILAVVRAMTGMIADAPMADWVGWLPLVAVINFTYSVVSFLTFRYVVEE